MKHIAQRLTIAVLLLIQTIAVYANNVDKDSLILFGSVKSAIMKADLTDAYLIFYNPDGTPKDTISTLCTFKRDGETLETSQFALTVARKDSTYVFDVECPGFQTKTVTYQIDKIGKRENYRAIPTIYLEREAHKLGEVTVTASKIKFYNKGDTLVYNADAFQLAEGSMLDALIEQLPGVELKDDGQITVNGEFVESLLLDGKQFLDGNNQLMLENIGAYAVKSVEVYKGQTIEEKWQNDPLAPKHLTMDVRFKKEYNLGWLINAQGGYGTEDRYSGRLFASMFTPTTNLTFLTNFNNLNDNRKPGKTGTWTPEMMPSGTKRYKMASINYNYQSSNEKNSADGYLTFEETTMNNRTTTARTNFLSGGNTYDNIFSNNRNSNLKLETRNYLRRFTESVYMGAMILGRYIKKSESASDISASFDTEQTDMTRKVLEAIYSDGSPQQLDAVINRSITKTNGSSHEKEFQFYPGINYKIPHSNDRLFWEVGMKYNDKKEDRWNDYLINYGADPNPAVRKQQYIDNSPNRSLTLISTSSYSMGFHEARLSIEYEYRFVNRDRDSYTYALDNLADMGIYGTLPSNYLDTFDPSNSYTSRLMENKHTISPLFSWRHVFTKNNSELQIFLHPELSIYHQHLDYWRDNRSYLVKRSSFMAVAKNGRTQVSYNFGMHKKNGRNAFAHGLEYNYTIETKTPDPLHMIDVVNDADPLNISLGNPDLENAYTHKHRLSLRFIPARQILSNRLAIDYEYTTDAIVRGYTYDTSTGIRRNKSYNVSGNNSIGISNHFSLQFGNRDQFTLSSSTSGSKMNYADMIGVNLGDPVKSTVSSEVFNESIKFSWNIDKHNIGLVGNITTRHTTSTRDDFTPINAQHYNYGITWQFRLPYGFGISTDLMMYTRHGYGSKQLDTTDAIWNMRLTYTPGGGRWVIMADGFDMLHQLSNVNYAINASGRTVTYTNALPRYIMLSVQYRLNIQPKKSKIR